MKVYVLSLFPDLVEAYFAASIMQKAVQRDLVSYEVINIRDFAADKHRSADDYPYGGGAGMVLKPEPLAGALDSIGAKEIRTVYPTPSGEVFDQDRAALLAAEPELVFICGRYEGIDQRVIDIYVDDELSIGDYVMSSGELASLVIIDAVFRLVDGVICRESLDEESFQGGLLEYPQYTRPEEFRGLRVPEVLLSGHHARITDWRHERSLDKTKRNRPELYEAWAANDKRE